MSYSIRIGFLLAIFSVVFGVGIYHGYQPQPRHSSSIISNRNLRAVLSGPVQQSSRSSFDLSYDQPEHVFFPVLKFRHSIFDLETQGLKALWPANTSSTIAPDGDQLQLSLSGFTTSFSVSAEELWPKSQPKSVHLIFVYREIIFKTSPHHHNFNPTTLLLGYEQLFSFLRQEVMQKINAQSEIIFPVTQPFFQRLRNPDLIFKPSWVLSGELLWPNFEQQFISAPVRAKISPVEVQELTQPDLKFALNFPDFKIQERVGLFPHRYLHVVRPVVIEQALPLSHSQSWHVATFFSGYIQLFERVSQKVFQAHTGQTENIITAQQKIIPPVFSLQASLATPPIAIRSAALMGDVGHTQLIIRLSEKPFYIVRTDDAHKTITLMIDNINPDISSIPPLDTQGTAIQNISFNVTPNNQFLVTLSLFPQTDVQGLRYKDNDLVIDVGLDAQIPYIQSQNTTSTISGPVQLLVKVPVPLSPNELAIENYNEAVDLLNQGNTQGATALLEMLVTQHPDYLDGRILLSNLLLQQNNASEALNVLAGAVPQPIFQDNQVYYNLLAEAYRQSGDFRSAVKIYQQLLSMNSSNGNWWVGLGMCFEGLGQSSASIAAYQKAQSSGNLSPFLQTFVSKKLDAIE